MASFFTSKMPTQTAKMIPNGGLGGLVSPGRECTDQANNELDFKLRRKRRCRPPPLRISNGCEHSTTSPAQFSAVSSLGLGGLWTPKTPIDRWKHSLLGNCDAEVAQSPTSSRFNSAEPSKAQMLLPETPITPRQFSLVELPGSLLLASQGFPQTYPISPPPSLELLRRNTAESAVSSVPSLCASLSTEEGTMDTLRHLTSRKQDRSRSDMPTYTIGSRDSPAITKPFATMTVEELLNTLVDIDSATISQHWLPAMRMQMDKMINILNEAGGLQIESSVDQVTLNNALTTFANQMRTITANYRRVVDQAESLAERDAKANNERVKGLEGRVDEAVEMLEAKDKEIVERDQRILELRNTVHEIARLLGNFIETNIPDWTNIANKPRTQQVLRIITDYTQDLNPDAVDYVRVPEDTLNKNAAALRDARNLNNEFQKLLRGQAAIIKDLGQTSDAQVGKYEKAVRLVQEKDHEIVLLVQQNNDITKQLQDIHAALVESQEIAAEAETASRRYEELRGNMESLKTAHELELDQKDAEIANLRQKLGSAREEVIARREDVKNVVAQTQAKLQSQSNPQAATAKNSNASKALRFFGMERDKYKKGNVPGSHSTMGLSSYDTGYSTKEVAPAVDKDVLRHRPSLQMHTNPRSAQTMPNTPVNNFQSSIDPAWVAPETRTRSVSFAPMPPRRSPMTSNPPRSDSLGYGSNPTSPISPVIKDKPLPDYPLSRTQLATARLAGMTAPLDSPLQAQITSDYLSHGIMGQTSQSARRVLSKITEVSTPVSRRSRDEDDFAKLQRVREDDGSVHSVASSDREVYRKSISALDMLNSSTGLPYNETETEIERIMRGTGTDGGPAIIRSPPPRSASRHPAATYNNTVYTDGQNEEEAQIGVARVLHVRDGSRDLRRVGGTHDGILDSNPYTLSGGRELGIIGQERPQRHFQYRRESSGESIQERRFRNPARESFASNGSSAGYRTEDSEPKTVAQLYHMGGKHIRG